MNGKQHIDTNTNIQTLLTDYYIRVSFDNHSTDLADTGLRGLSNKDSVYKLNHKDSITVTNLNRIRKLSNGFVTHQKTK